MSNAALSVDHHAAYNLRSSSMIRQRLTFLVSKLTLSGFTLSLSLKTTTKSCSIASLTSSSTMATGTEYSLIGSSSSSSDSKVTVNDVLLKSAKSAKSAIEASYCHDNEVHIYILCTFYHNYIPKNVCYNSHPSAKNESLEIFSCTVIPSSHRDVDTGHYEP